MTAAKTTRKTTTRKTTTKKTVKKPDVLDFNTDFAKDGGDALGKLLRSHKFQTLIHSDKGDDSVEMIWTVNKFIEATLTKEGAKKLFDAYDDVMEAFEYLTKKVQENTASATQD